MCVDMKWHQSVIASVKTTKLTIDKKGQVTLILLEDHVLLHIKTLARLLKTYMERLR